jgi:preprotein translocase subunit SecE
MSAIGNYISSTKAELTKVSWPTKRQVAVFTGAIIAVSIAMSLILGFFDYVFSSGLSFLIESSDSNSAFVIEEDVSVGSDESVTEGGDISAPIVEEGVGEKSIEIEPIDVTTTNVF